MKRDKRQIPPTVLRRYNNNAAADEVQAESTAPIVLRSNQIFNPNNSNNLNAQTVQSPTGGDDDLITRGIEEGSAKGKIPRPQQIPTVQRPQSGGDEIMTLGSTELDNSADSAQTQKPTSNVPSVATFEERRRALREKQQQLNQPTQKSEDSRLHSGVEAIGKALEYFNPQYGIIKNWDEFFGRLAAVPGAFVGGMINDKWDEENSRLRNLDKVNKQLGELNTEEEFTNKQNLVREQTRTIAADDEARQRQLTETERRNRENEAQKTRQNFVNRIWKSQKYWDPAQANEIDRQELARMGMKPDDIAAFDFRDAGKTIKIGGDTFVWNRQSQTYEQSGLPTDGSEAILDYVITDTDGVKHTIKVKSKDAARLITSTKNAQMQIEAANNRQDKQQTFTAQQNQLNRQQQWSQFMETLKLNKTKQGFDRAKAKNEINKDFNEGKITEEEKNQAIAELDGQ